MKCPECNNIVPDGSRFCNHCGHKFEQENTIKCPNPECGHSIPADSKFCPDCGSKVTNIITAGKLNKFILLAPPSSGFIPALMRSVIERKEDEATLKYCYIDIEGNVVFRNDSWTDVHPFIDGYAMVEYKGSINFIDTSGQELLLKYVYNKTRNHIFDKNVSCNGIAAVAVLGKESFVNLKNGTRFNLYDEVKPFSCSIAAVKNDGKWGYIDVDDNLVIPFEYDEVGQFDEGIAIVRKSWCKYIINTSGNIITELNEDFDINEHSYFSDGLAIVDYRDEKCYINKSGSTVGCGYGNAYGWDSALPFQGGMAAVEDMEGWYFINSKGEDVFEKYFDGAKSFSEGFAAVKKGYKWAFIDSRGKLLTDFIYDDTIDTALRFENGYALVIQNESSSQPTALINRKGIMLK